MNLDYKSFKEPLLDCKAQIIQGYRQYDKNKHEKSPVSNGICQRRNLWPFSQIGAIDEHVRLSLQFWYKKRTDSLSNELAEIPCDRLSTVRSIKTLPLYKI